MQIALALYPRFTMLAIIGPFQVLADVPGNEVVFVAAQAGPVVDHTGRAGLVATKSFADVPADDESDAPALPKGAKAPLKSGKAPKGYEVKGNADSGKYHEPDGQWYDATEAEFWFKSAEDAEAAGFVRAGGPKEDDK